MSFNGSMGQRVEVSNPAQQNTADQLFAAAEFASIYHCGSVPTGSNRNASFKSGWPRDEHLLESVHSRTQGRHPQTSKFHPSASAPGT